MKNLLSGMKTGNHKTFWVSNLNNITYWTKVYLEGLISDS